MAIPALKVRSLLHTTAGAVRVRVMAATAATARPGGAGSATHDGASAHAPSATPASGNPVTHNARAAAIRTKLSTIDERVSAAFTGSPLPEYRDDPIKRPAGCPLSGCNTKPVARATGLDIR